VSTLSLEKVPLPRFETSAVGRKRSLARLLVDESLVVGDAPVENALLPPSTVRADCDQQPFNSWQEAE